MDSRASMFRLNYHDEREHSRLLCWNGGRPLIIDGRFKKLRTFEIEGTFEKKDLLEWAAKNQVRCVGFEGDSRPPRRSFHICTWAVEG